MQNESLQHLIMLGIGLVASKLWLDDYRRQRRGESLSRAIPGALPSTTRSVVIASLGGIAIVSAETWGESALGLTGEQSTITILFAIYTLVAAIVEEIVFRGYIVITKKGPATVAASALGASVIFAALHPFLWKWTGGMPWADGKIVLTFGAKGWFSTGAVFISSLWFYYVRFARFNPQQSLLPCFAAHASKNAGAIIAKAFQGFISGFW
ncbi:MAG: CPBP family glutamic-type intramembrane protease [Nibricoccus sp.]